MPSADEAFALLGFTANEKAQLRAGKTVSRESEERDDELSVSFARTIPLPLDTLIDDVRSGKLGWLGQEILAMAEVDVNRPIEDSFKTVTFGSDEQAEIDGLLTVQPGTRFNLSEDEIDRFVELRTRLGKSTCKGDPNCAEAVVREYQAVLVGRMRAYLGDGLSSVEPYARENGKNSKPSGALKLALKQSQLLADRFPAEYHGLKSYPEATEDATDHYFWIKVPLEGRPTFALAHRRIFTRAEGTLCIEREFYAGHSYNAVQIVAGAIPDGKGTMVLYANRTFTDLLAGLGQSMRHSIGRNRLKKVILDYMDSLTPPE